VLVGVDGDLVVLVVIDDDVVAGVEVDGYVGVVDDVDHGDDCDLGLVLLDLLRLLHHFLDRLIHICPVCIVHERKQSAICQL